MDRDPRWATSVPEVRAAADALADHQKQRLRVANQYQAMVTPQGKRGSNGYYGKGLREDDPVVVQKAAVLAFLRQQEKEFVKILKTRMRQHPLAAWVKVQPGIGELAIGRLLGLIDDPAWHPRFDRPRRLGELNRYCGMDVNDGVAPRKTRGVQGDGNPDARTRLIVIAVAAIKQRCETCRDAAASRREESDESTWAPPPPDCTCAKDRPYRAVYDEARIKYGSDEHLSDLHKANRARRLVAKAILKDLWIEARRIDGLVDN